MIELKLSWEEERRYEGAIMYKGTIGYIAGDRDRTGRCTKETEGDLCVTTETENENRTRKLSRKM